MKNLKRKIFLAASVAVLSTVVLGGCGKLNDSEVVAEVGEYVSDGRPHERL